MTTKIVNDIKPTSIRTIVVCWRSRKGAHYNAPISNSISSSLPFLFISDSHSLSLSILLWVTLFGCKYVFFVIRIEDCFFSVFCSLVFPIVSIQNVIECVNTKKFQFIPNNKIRILKSYMRACAHALIHEYHFFSFLDIKNSENES